MSDESKMTPRQALEQLILGNMRFYSDSLSHSSRADSVSRKGLLEGQRPFAAILGCADSRTSPEHIFDAGLGEIFVVRNAGNLADTIAIGSIEYAVEHTGCPLVCVMGHNSCGAMRAAVAAAAGGAPSGSPHIQAIIQRAMPSVKAATAAADGERRWADAAALRNVVAACEEILSTSRAITRRVESGTVGLAGLFYDLSTGKVEVVARYGPLR